MVASSSPGRRLHVYKHFTKPQFGFLCCVNRNSMCELGTACHMFYFRQYFQFYQEPLFFLDFNTDLPQEPYGAGSQITSRENSQGSVENKIESWVVIFRDQSLMIICVPVWSCLQLKQVVSRRRFAMLLCFVLTAPSLGDRKPPLCHC